MYILRSDTFIKIDSPQYILKFQDNLSYEPVK